MISMNITNKTNNRDDEVVFMVQFEGKTVGELGVLAEDLHELNWNQFKSYLSHNFPVITYVDDIDITYSDEEGDSLPIASDAEYREALKIAKWKTKNQGKLVLKIGKPKSYYPGVGSPTGANAVLSMVSSSIKKVTSSPPKEGILCFGEVNTKTSNKTTDPQPLFNMNPSPSTFDAAEVGYPADGEIWRDSGNSTGNNSWAARHRYPYYSKESSSSSSRTRRGKKDEESSGSRRKKDDEKPPQWFLNYMHKFKHEFARDLKKEQTRTLQFVIDQNRKIGSALKAIGKHQELLDKMRNDQLILLKNHQCVSTSESRSDKCTTLKRKSLLIQDEDEVQKCKQAREEISERERLIKKFKQKEEKIMKKLRKEEEKLKQRIARNDERSKGKPHQDKNRQRKKSERSDKKNMHYRHSDYVGGSATHDKVLMRIEKLRKKQSFSTMEVNKLRKIIDKMDKKGFRINEDRTYVQRYGKNRFSIDNKQLPMSPWVLARTLNNLEELAEEKSDATTLGYDAKFVNDETYPDGTKVSPGKVFRKTWSVVNSGTKAWNDKTMLCKWSQVTFRGSPHSRKLQPVSKKVHCPRLAPGEQGFVSVDFTSPMEPGWYATHWRFCHRGHVFGNQMWCTVEVVPGHDSSADEIEEVSNSIKKTLTIDKSCAKRSIAHYFNTDCTQPAVKPFSSILKNICTEPLFRPPVSEQIASLMEERNKDLIDLEDNNFLQDIISPGDKCPTEKFPMENMLNQQLDDKAPLLSADEDEAEEEDDSSDEESEEEEEEEEHVENEEYKHIPLVEEQDVIERDFNADTFNMDSNENNIKFEKISNLPMSPNPIDNEYEIIQFGQDGEKDSDETEKSVPNDCADNDLSKSPFEQLLTAYKPRLKPYLSEEISLSSGSFSELDSEDEAILNETDSEKDSSDYCLLELPECFNIDNLELTPALQKLRLNSKQDDKNDQESDEDNDANESDFDDLGQSTPEYLSADEDDKNDTTLSNEDSTETNQSLQQNPLDLSIDKEHSSGSKCGEGAKASSVSRIKSSDKIRSYPEEVESVNPEDLVHGAWNTARSFIKTINKGLGSESSSPNEHTVRVGSQALSELIHSQMTEELKQLEEMGFTDKSFNYKLLSKHRNDVTKVVAELIVLQNQ